MRIRIPALEPQNVRLPVSPGEYGSEIPTSCYCTFSDSSIENYIIPYNILILAQKLQSKNLNFVSPN